MAASLGAFIEAARVYSARALNEAGIVGPRGALRWAEKVRGLAGLLPDDEVSWYAGYAEWTTHYLRGEYRLAAAKARLLLERPGIDDMPSASELTPLRPAPFLRAGLALALSRLGEFADVERLIALVRAVQAREETPLGLAFLRALEGGYLLARGQPEGAARALAEGLAHAEQGGSRRLTATIRSVLGPALIEAGQFKQAVEVLSEALEIYGGADFGSGNLLPRRARAYLGIGQIAEAREDAETAIALTRRFEHRAGEGEAHLSLALVHAASEPPDYSAAEEEFAEAEKCLRECEYRTELAAALRAHGELRLETQGGAAARPLLEETRELYAYLDRRADIEAMDALLEGS